MSQEYVTATGGTVTTVCTNFKIHTFTGPGTFCVSNAGNAPGSNTVDYLVSSCSCGGGGSTLWRKWSRWFGELVESSGGTIPQLTQYLQQAQ